MNTRFTLIPTDNSGNSIVDGITIDAPESMDLDDAVWIDEVDGRQRVTVSIADVATGIPKNSELDIQARQRGFTRYFARGNAPMLPHGLAEDRLSLWAGRERRVLCIQTVLDDALDPIEVAVHHARLTVSARLSHADVTAIIENRPATETQTALRPMLNRLVSLAGRLLEKRRMRGELAFYDLHKGWTLSEEGALRELGPNEKNIGYVLIQELMILVNRTLAELLVRADVPALYRNHVARAAAPERASLLTDIRTAVLRPDLYNVETLRDRLQLLLSRARYGPDLHGHFGLNLPAYLHFTSPIRRYADLVNHRVLSALLQGDPSPYTRTELVEIGDHLNRLIDEEDTRKAEAYKLRAQARAEALVDAERVRIARLTASEGYQVLKASVGRDLPPQPLLEVVATRLKSGTISEKEAYFLLFETPHDSAEWADLRLSALEWLMKHPFHAVSLIIIGVQAKSWADSRYSFTIGVGRFWCTASVVRQQEQVESGARSASSKKSAQQRAALALCYRLLGVPLPVALEETAALMASGKNSEQGPMISKAEKRRVTAAQHAEDLASRGDWVSAVWHLLKVLCVKLPRMTNRIVNEAGEDCYYCKLSMVWTGQPLEHEGSGPTRQQAKQQAARALWQDIQRLRAEEIGK